MQRDQTEMSPILTALLGMLDVIRAYDPTLARPVIRFTVCEIDPHWGRAVHVELEIKTLLGDIDWYFEVKDQLCFDAGFMSVSNVFASHIHEDLIAPSDTIDFQDVSFDDLSERIRDSAIEFCRLYL